MSDWRWFTDFSQDARRRGDGVPGELLRVHEQAFQLRETDPERALTLFAEGERLARGYGHPWWLLLFEQWQVHAMIYYIQDYRTITERAVRNLLTVRRPLYANYPQGPWIPIDLVTIYQCIDPLGYEEEIRAAITHLEGEGDRLASNARYLLQIRKINYAIIGEDLNTALELTSMAQGWLEADSDGYTAGHFRVDFDAYPALVAFKRRDWAGLAVAAEVAEGAARQRKVHSGLGNALMWQAVAASHSGDRGRAGRLYRAAQSQRTTLGRPPGSWFYDAWAAYEERVGSLPEVCQVRTREYNDIRNRGMLAYECRTLTEICRLKTLMGSFQPEDRATADQAASRLRKPQKYIAALELAVTGRPSL